ncbi:MAG: glycogen debranching N-terminal domain-containing protein [Chloroflexota bacterium]
MAKRARKPEGPGLSLKGSGLVFVGTRGGDIRGPSRRGAGVYAWDTRHLSRYEVRPRVGTLRLHSAEVLPDGARLTYAFGRGVHIERDIHIDSTIKDEWSLTNTGTRAATFDAEIVADADFRDLFEVRRRVRTTRGTVHDLSADAGTLRLAYTAIDGVGHATEIVAPVTAWRVTRAPARARVRTVVPHGERRAFSIEVRVRSTLGSPKLGKRDWPAWQNTSTRFASDSSDLDAWLAQSSLDLFLLSDRTPDGYFPSAGIPWFVAPFGRDSILTALFALPLRRDLAPAVLRMLADHQGRADVPQRDEGPGRIAHEIRQGEIVRTGGAFGTPYYGSVDATPLFVWLAAEAARWMPERDLIGEFETPVRAALAWMDERGDLDGDGFIEFERQAPTGILNQMWKDSGESLLDAKGDRPPGPIAALEIQAYAYAAWRSLAEIVARRDARWAASLDARADAMLARFERAFWVEERSFYAQALDGAKRQIRDVVSNPGHVLWAGIASRAHGRRAARRLREPDLASGWGIRTRSSRSKHYDAGSYQNGAVWPHDTAIAAAGMARYGDREGAARTMREILDTATAFPDRRLPELFGGDPRRAGRSPKTYPVACSPQAWSAAAAFLCVRTMLGLELAPDGRSITLDPILPDGIDRFEARGLRVGTGTIDVDVARTRGRSRIRDVQASGISVTTR